MKPRSALLAGIAAIAVIGAAACSHSGSSSSQSAAATSSVPSAAQATPATADSSSTASTGANDATASAKLNLNTATKEQFLTVPGVGDRFVREFEEYRPYTSITQFRRELGKYVSQDQVATWEKYVYVPVAPNQADAATLQQLPGVTADIAAQLIAARPYASTDAFLSKLAQLVPSDQAAAARTYVAAS
jgi:DNA uptake protein ComE-like DNA-binding protein